MKDTTSKFQLRIQALKLVWNFALLHSIQALHRILFLDRKDVSLALMSMHLGGWLHRMVLDHQRSVAIMFLQGVSKIVMDVVKFGCWAFEGPHSLDLYVQCIIHTFRCLAGMAIRALVSNIAHLEKGGSFWPVEFFYFVFSSSLNYVRIIMIP